MHKTGIHFNQRHVKFVAVTSMKWKLMISCITLVYLFIYTLQHKCWRSVGHQVLQPAKDIEFRKICLKSCLYDERNYHYFCETHGNKLKCLIHTEGKKYCEAKRYSKLVKKYTWARYTCLDTSKYHFFCEQHFQVVNCSLHPTGYRQ